MTTSAKQNFFGIQVSVNNDGLYCLNDIHYAAGKRPSKSPRHWLANKRTKLFIAACADSRFEQSHGGESKGTYASKDLAIHYSSWASAHFHIRFIRSIIPAIEGDRAAVARKTAEANDPSINWFA